MLIFGVTADIAQNNDVAKILHASSFHLTVDSSIMIMQMKTEA